MEASRFEFETVPGDGRGEKLKAAGGNLNPPSLTTWRLLLAEKPWTHVFDIGANYGEMIVHADLPPGAEAIAFEPNPDVRACLERNLAAAGRRAAVSPAAVSDRSGDAVLMIDRQWSGSSRLHGAAADNPLLAPVHVATTTIADQLAAVAPSSCRLLLKIDVEGQESAVLRGALSLLDGLADFAALVEVLHLSPADLDWLVRRFTLRALDTQDQRLVHLAVDSGTALAERLRDPALYPQDIVIRRRPGVSYDALRAGHLADGRRACVYTALLGGYEELNEQPMAAQSGLPFICFTDDPKLTSDTWDIRLVPPLFPSDTVRSQRALKLQPFDLLDGCDASLYIDNSVILSAPPENLFERYLPPGTAIAVPLHSFRDTVEAEFAAVAADNLDSIERIAEQLEHYRADHPSTLAERPFWSAIMLRDHRDPGMRAAMRAWLFHIARYARRDQLSANVAFRLGGITPSAISIDNYRSDFHTWPVTRGRDIARRSTPKRAAHIPVDVQRLQRAEEEVIATRAEMVLLSKEIVARRRSADLHANRLAEAQALSAELAARLEEAAAEHAAQGAAYASLGRECESLKAHRDALLASTSWRITAPIRRLRTLTRRGRQP